VSQRGDQIRGGAEDCLGEPFQSSRDLRGEVDIPSEPLVEPRLRCLELGRHVVGSDILCNRHCLTGDPDDKRDKREQECQRCCDDEQCGSSRRSNSGFEPRLQRGEHVGEQYGPDDKGKIRLDQPKREKQQGGDQQQQDAALGVHGVASRRVVG